MFVGRRASLKLILTYKRLRKGSLTAALNVSFFFGAGFVTRDAAGSLKMYLRPQITNQGLPTKRL